MNRLVDANKEMNLINYSVNKKTVFSVERKNKANRVSINAYNFPKDF